MTIRPDVSAVKSDDTAIPASSRLTVVARPCVCESVSTISTAAIENANANSPVNRISAPPPISVHSATPNAAPDDTPSMCGSAIGLWNKPCIHAPQTDSAMPTR